MLPVYKTNFKTFTCFLISPYIFLHVIIHPQLLYILTLLFFIYTIGYHWDISDWVSPDKTVNNNFIDESPTEGQDSSSVQSTDSNSFVSQIELVPDKEGASPVKRDQNKTTLVSSSPSKPKIDLEANSTNANSKHQHGNSAHTPLLGKEDSPPPCYSNNVKSSWADFSDDDETYGFPTRGGRGFRVALESGDYGAVNRDTDNMYLDGLDSDNASVSGVSAKVCELDDSEADTCDVDTLPPPKDYASMPSYV